MTEINKEQLAVWANGYRCDSDMDIKTMAKMLLDFMDREEKEPVTWPDMPFSFEELEQMHGATFANGYIRGWARKCESVTMKGSLYTTPQPAHTGQDGCKLVPVEVLATASTLIDLCRTYTILQDTSSYKERTINDCENTMEVIDGLLAAAPEGGN